jgi:hypothetical protein
MRAVTCAFLVLLALGMVFSTIDVYYANRLTDGAAGVNPLTVPTLCVGEAVVIILTAVIARKQT